MQDSCEPSREVLLVGAVLEEQQGCGGEGHPQQLDGSCPERPKNDDFFDQFLLKVLPCTKHYTHDWTACPYAHLGEKAARRDPRTYSYTGIACVSMKQEGRCALGDSCPYAHNAFEYWLHPTRYHTEICKQGTKCNRKICFFAHRPTELRRPPVRPGVRPEAMAMSALAAAASLGSSMRGPGTGTAFVPPPPPRRSTSMAGVSPLAMPPPPLRPASLMAASAASAAGRALGGVAGGMAPALQGTSAVSNLAAALLASELLTATSQDFPTLAPPPAAVLPCSLHSSSSSNPSPTRVLSRLGSTESTLQDPAQILHLAHSPPPISSSSCALPTSGDGLASVGLATESPGTLGSTITSPSGALDPAVQGVISLLGQQRISVEQAAEALSSMLGPDALLQLQFLLLQA